MTNTISWLDGISGDFADGANWSTGTVPGSDDIAHIEAAGTYTVTSSMNEDVHSLAVTQGAALDLTGGTFGAGLHGTNLPELTVGADASISIGSGATLELGADSAGQSIVLAGNISVGPGGKLKLAQGLRGSVGTSGGGTISLNGEGSEVIVDCAAGIQGTIQGTGEITSSVVGFASLSASLIDANQLSSELDIILGDAVNFDQLPAIAGIGVIEATDGSGLLLSGQPGDGMTVQADVQAGPGLIQALGKGSYVNFDDVTVQGGTLSTSGGGIMSVLAGGATLNSFDPFGDNGAVFNTGSLKVSDGATLAVAGTLDNSGTISVASGSGGAVMRLETKGDLTVNFKDTAATRVIEFTGNGTIALSDSAANAITASHAIDTMDNEGNTISGAGQIGGGSAMNITNRGVIAATGVNTLVIDIVTGKLSNGAAGVLEGSGAGGLSITGGTVKNTGTVQALDGSSVTFGSGSTITNDVGGKLSGGHWFVTDGGHGASLTLSGAAVTSLAGKVELSGAGSVMATGGGTLLEASLTTIAAGGDLELLNGRGWTSALSLTDNAQLKLIGGTFAAAGLTVGAAGTVSAVGTIAAPTRDNGLVQAYRGVLDITGDITGSGTLKILGSSSLEIGGAIASTVDVLFGTGTHETLKVDHPGAFASTLTNWSYGDTIDLAATDATAAQIVGNTLEIDLSGGGTLDYALANASAGRLVLASDGAGGTNITLYRAKAPAALAQAMGAMAGGGTGGGPSLSSASESPSPPALAKPG
ncbi:MAG TPA: hypothetical protein VG166_07765 [Caulobacteraceae bacterium]|jgi:hypothetical protein|nr:hypothetical protein [Caulobacteraceae bacterium]